MTGDRRLVANLATVGLHYTRLAADLSRLRVMFPASVFGNYFQ